MRRTRGERAKKPQLGAGRRRLTRKQVKDLRRSQGWSARTMAQEMGNGLPGYSRSYIKSIEGGSLPITERFEARFKILRARLMGERARSKDIVSRYRLPRQLVLLAKPKRCPTCKWFFVGRVPAQKYCSDECGRAARQAARARARARATRRRR
jgi:transcriptional regulator with XRE-family HTH domain